MHTLTTDEISDLDLALQTTLSKGHTSCDTMTKEDFPLRSSAQTLELLLDSVENDMGMFVLRGFPVKNYTVEHMRMIYWGLGLHLGVAVSQSGKGMIGSPRLLFSLAFLAYIVINIHNRSVETTR